MYSLNAKVTEEKTGAERLECLDRLFPHLQRNKLMNEEEYRDVASLLAAPGLASDSIWQWLQEVSRYLQRLEGRVAERRRWSGIPERSFHATAK